MGGMPDWFAKTKEMVASDRYFSFADGISEGELIDRYRAALTRLDTAPQVYAQQSAALSTVWADPARVAASLGGHFVGDWIHYRAYSSSPAPGDPGGSYWPLVHSSTVIKLVREGTRLAIHKALGTSALASVVVPNLPARQLDDMWAPELANGVEIDGVRPLATSWNCVAPAGSTYFEVAAIRGPSIVEFAIATPKPYGRSSMMDAIERMIDGFYKDPPES